MPDLEQYAWRTFESGDGLPVGEVRDIEQDADGFLYVATARGLVRFDGQAFTAVDLSGMSTSVVSHLFRDSSERLWLVSGEAEIGIVDGTDVRRLEISWGSDGVPRMGGNRLVYADFVETSDKDIWLPDDDGLLRLRPDANPPLVYFGQDEGLPRDSVLGLFEVADWERVVVTTSGFFRYAPEEGGFGRFQRFGPRVEAGSTVRHDSRGIWVRLRDGTTVRYGTDGFVTFGRGGRPLRLDSLGWSPGAKPITGSIDDAPPISATPGESPPPRPVRFARTFVTRSGQRFVTGMTSSGSYALFSWRLNRLWNIGVGQHSSAHSIRVLFEDHEGSIWLGTDKGLVQLTPRRVLVLADDHPVADMFTAPILQTMDGSVWVGTWGRGLFRFGADGGTERYSVADGLPADRVRSLYEDPDGTLWVGTVLGFVARSTAGEWSEPTTTDEVRGFQRDRSGRLWIATLSRIWLLTKSELKAVHDDAPWAERIVRLIHIDTRGRTWVGTEHGLFRLSGTDIERFGVEDGLSDDRVASIFEEDDGTLWVGTYEHGLHRYRGEHFVRVTTRAGLHHDGIWQIVADGRGGYWMSSDRGIGRVSKSALHRVADAIESGQPDIPRLEPTTFGLADGMRSSESNRASPAGVRLRDGRIVFNGLSGINVIQPERALAAAPPSKTIIGSMVADGNTLASLGADSVGSFTLNPPPRHISFQMSALSFSAPERVEYRYRMEGYEDDWRFNGTRSYGDYTNLAPGDYRLRIQNRPAHGTWGGEAQLSLSIPPRLWERGSFRALLGLLVILALVLIHRSRVNRLLGVERIRLQIAGDLHDQVGSSLSSIVLLSEMLRKESPTGAVQMRQLERIGRAAEDSVAALRDVIWMVDPQMDRLTALVDRMGKSLEEMLPGVEISFRRELSGDPSVSPSFQRDVFLIFKEAMHNILKHAHASHVEVDVRGGSRRLDLTIRDNGVGFDPARATCGYGLGTMNRRAERIGGVIKIGSADGGGTTVILGAPIP